MNKLNEIKEVYYSETQKKLNSIRKKLVEVEQDNSKIKEVFLEIYKLAHSIKNESYALGLSDISEEIKIVEEKAINISKRTDLYDKYKTTKNFSDNLNNIKDFLFISANSHLNDTIYLNIKGIENIKDLFVSKTKSNLNRIKEKLNDIDNGKEDLSSFIDQTVLKLKNLKEETYVIGLEKTTPMIYDFLKELEKIKNESKEYNKNIYEDITNHIQILKVLIDNIYLDENIKYDRNASLIGEYIINQNNTLEFVYTSLLKLDSENSNQILDDIYKKINELLSEANFLELTSIVVMLNEFRLITLSLKSESNPSTSNDLQKLFSIIHNLKGIIKAKFSKYQKEIITPNETSSEEESSNNEIIYIYAIESIEHINTISEKLNELKTNKNKSITLLKEIFREINTIIGDSSTVGLNKIAEKANDFLQKISNYMKNPETIDEVSISELISINNQLQDLIKSKLITSTVTNEIKEENEEDPKNEIVELYSLEVKSRINNISDNILLLMEDKTNVENVLREISIELNTIIGDSETLGFNDVSSFASKIQYDITNLIKAPNEIEDSDLEKILYLNKDLENTISSSILNNPSNTTIEEKEVITNNSKELNNLSSSTIIDKEALTIVNDLNTSNMIQEQTIIALKKIFEDVQKHVLFCKEQGILDRRTLSALQKTEENFGQILLSTEKENKNEHELLKKLQNIFPVK
jgi:hypothetical protein